MSSQSAALLISVLTGRAQIGVKNRLSEVRIFLVVVDAHHQPWHPHRLADGFGHAERCDDAIPVGGGTKELENKKDGRRRKASPACGEVLAETRPTYQGGGCGLQCQKIVEKNDRVDKQKKYL